LYVWQGLPAQTSTTVPFACRKSDFCCRAVGDAYDNAMAESFVDSFKTELIADRVWRTRSQLELAVVEYISWFNHDRLHESLNDTPPVEFEALYAQRFETVAR
jgi:transposase InsO family protein